jgi:hypothetical protein
MLAAYVSGHGYGHATRVAEVLRSIREREPSLPLAVASSAPARLFAREVSGSIEFRPVECDVGLAQRGALIIDEAASLARCREFGLRWNALVEDEGLAPRPGAAGPRHPPQPPRLPPRSRHSP